LATLVTPNLPEAEALTGLSIKDPDGMAAAGRALVALGARAALIKGGHLDHPQVIDVLVTAGGVETFTGPRFSTTSTHGTGCTLASGIATGLAQGLGLKEAVERSIAYVRAALANAPGFGAGHGPLDHGYALRSKPT